MAKRRFQGPQDEFSDRIRSSLKWWGTLDSLDLITDEAELKKLWRRHRKAFMQQWSERMQQDGIPAKRPWGWWLIEARDLRLRITDDADLEPGVPPAEYLPADVADHYESNAAYLYRLGLLEPWEIEALDAAQPEDDPEDEDEEEAQDEGRDETAAEEE